MSYLLLYSSLSPPVIADDFIHAFDQSLFYKANDKSAFLDAVIHGWKTGTEGAGFRPVGDTIGASWLWAWTTLSATFDVSMHMVYMLTKFVVYLAAAISISTFWWVASKHYGRGIRYWDGLVLSSVALFGTLQIHALWGADPVVGSPLAGYGSTAISFGVLTAAVLAVQRQSHWFLMLAVSASTLSILHYELNLGAVLGAGVIFAGGCWVHRSDRRLLIHNVIYTAIALGIPVLVALYGRRVVLDNGATYAGTQIRISGMPKTFVMGVANGFPGSAWGTALKHLEAPSIFIASSFGTVVVVACLLLWWRKEPSFLQLNPRTDAVGGAAMRVAIVAGVGVCALGSIGLQAITIKVQLETLGLGYVYTHYSISSGVVALGFAIMTPSLLARRRVVTRRGVATGRVFAISAGLTLLYVQSMINWQLMEKLNEVYAPNRQIFGAFDKDVDEPTRCEVLKTWDGSGWPEYYEIGVVEGLQHAYKIYFGEPFCRGFIRAD